MNEQIRQIAERLAGVRDALEITPEEMARVCHLTTEQYLSLESGTVDDIFYDPRHPYTWGLLSSMPDVDTTEKRLYTIPGTPPNLINEIRGDAFAPRNRYALKIDFRKEPPVFKINDHHRVRSWLAHPAAPKVEKPDLLEVKHLKQYFPLNRKFSVKAVDDISFHINYGETYGLVGESGSGKSTTGRSVIRLYNPTAGEIVFAGSDIGGKLTQKEKRLCWR